MLHCGSAAADPGCAVIVRYIAQVGRSAPREVVFAQMLAWFELAGAEPRIVSLNLVQPEDDPAAIRDFTLHMTMLDFLQRRYPRVPITLHAGELADGLVPPEALRFHVRQSVEVGHATRIGHGASIMNEDRPLALVAECRGGFVPMPIDHAAGEPLPVDIEPLPAPRLETSTRRGEPMSDENLETIAFEMGLVPPAALRFHVRQSVELGHAARIGHGASIMNEDRPFALLRELAAGRVLVEVALSSNEQILGGKGKQHPLEMLLKYRVPVAIVTDDMGVSRSSHTNELAKAVEDHGVDYSTLKRMVRDSIDFAFVEAPTKARLKTDLENALAVFERQHAAATTLKNNGRTRM